MSNWHICVSSYAKCGNHSKVKVSSSLSILNCPVLSSHAGVVFGADDFLPCLTWVLLRSGVVTLQQDTDYMMELLDPTQLQGEGTADTLSLLLIHKLPPKYTVVDRLVDS